MNFLTKRFSKQFFVLLVALLPAIVPLASLQAQDGHAAVISIASIDEHLADVSYLMRAAGQADALPLIQLMAGAYVDGFDKKKPIGATVTFRGAEPRFLGFVPIINLDKVLAKIEDQAGRPEDAGDGVLKLSPPDGEEFYVKEKGGWAFIANDLMALTGVLPEDPEKLLAGLNEKYNLAFQVNIQNIPEPLKQLAIDKVKENAEQGGLEDLIDDDEIADALKKLNASSTRNMVQWLEEADQLTFGWGVDAMRHSTYIDITGTAKPGTKMAARMAQLAETKSKFAGFLLPGSGLNWNFAGELTMQDIEEFQPLVATMRDKAFAELEENEDLEGEELEGAKEVVGALFDVFSKTLNGGKLDGGCVLAVGENSFDFAAGGYVADGASADKAIRRVIELAKKDEEVPENVKFKLDAATHGNIKFHTVTIPVPEGVDGGEAFGEELTVAAGVGANTLLIAFGKDPVGILKTVIDKSAADAQKMLPPSQFNVALTPIMKFASSVSDDDSVAEVLKSLEQGMGNDKIMISTRPIKNGSATRIELQEGVLQAIGAAVKSVQEAFGAGAAPALGDDF